jgi:hypothetical protein
MVLQSVIDKCLNKDPGLRYHSAGEVRAALETAGTASRTEKFPVVTPSPGFWTWKSLLLICVVAGLAIGLGYWLQGRKNSNVAAVPGRSNPLQCCRSRISLATMRRIILRME